MSTIDNLTANFSKIFSKKFNSSANIILSVPIENSQEKVNYVLVCDAKEGIRRGCIIISNLGADINFLKAIANKTKNTFLHLEQRIYPTSLGAGDERLIRIVEMGLAKKIIIYTDKSCISDEEIKKIFSSNHIIVDIISEERMYCSVFITYGGPDESIAAKINEYLISRGVRTSFFPVDAIPGKKLHRHMFEGINDLDKVLLICSENSLNRPGVLNELEKVFEKEATNGGDEILIPITLDDYVYNWSPRDKKDRAEQIRNRVVGRVTKEGIMKSPSIELEKVMVALQYLG